MTHDELLRLIDETATQGFKTLDLAGEKLTYLPPEIAKLTQLKTLILGRWDPKRGKILGNSIDTLPEEIAKLRELESIFIYGNQLTELPKNIGKLSKLRSLFVGGNQLEELPQKICQLTKLKFLDLSNNRIKSLPECVGNLRALRFLDLHGNPLNLPMDLLNEGLNYEKPGSVTKVLEFYFSRMKTEESMPLYEAKILLLGEGGAGKTSLAKKINREDYTLVSDEETTEGIEITRWDFHLSENTTFRTNIWDFGGQEIYHATHQFFLTKRSLYLLVADTRKENTDFYYWLKIIELLSDGSPILIIKNEKQDHQCEVDEGSLKSQFKNLKDSYSTNLLDNRGLSTIKAAIRYHLSQLPHVGDPLPAFWIKVRADLEIVAEQQNTLNIEKYFDICRRHNCSDKQRMLLVSEYLHDLGVCLHFQDDKLLKRTIILRPEWATTAVYKVAHNNLVRDKKGRFTDTDIVNIWRDGQYAALHDELLQLMMRFKLAYEIPNMSGQYIAPQLLPVNKPDYAWDAVDNLILRYRYEFMPKGIVTRFIVETHLLIDDQDTVWRNGVVLADDWARAEVTENYSRNTINVRISGRTKKPLLEKVRYELWKIHESYEQLKYEELIPCNCYKCRSNQKPQMYSYNLLMKYISDNRYNIECRDSYKRIDVRSLISDITTQLDPHDMTTIEGNLRLLKEEVMHAPTRAPFGFYQDNRVIHKTEIQQYGVGDNVAGNKIKGDSHANSQRISELDSAQLCRAIKTLLEDLEQDYNPNTPRGQSNIHRDALNAIRDDIELKQALKDSFKAGLGENLMQMIGHPLAKSLLQDCKNLL